MAPTSAQQGAFAAERAGFDAQASIQSMLDAARRESAAAIPSAVGDFINYGVGQNLGASFDNQRTQQQDAFQKWQLAFLQNPSGAGQFQAPTWWQTTFGGR